ncbi:hypothetical protein FQN60_007846 [Etheostoma spectabile]|uniref:Uncharacterized protein n=1 Tax=Etheostoma spectabile TaxID=54343 RepID=A0A5J5CWW5_9PERO|nr:hypothetical protein FQN60_007846 [Etheostoma spectabile]
MEHLVSLQRRIASSRLQQGLNN